MIMMLSSLLYVYYVIVLVLKKRKKAPHKSQLLPKFKNDNHLKRSRAGMEKIRFASMDRIALQSSFSTQNLFKVFTFTC